ncbi:uncharacterized protein LOC125215276 [Salvia hispanica]|uniref:uncharacterized protein LOC125215276 n=1 Tax=Salvia hispanica TaxID=49212 RepID=UPI00200992E4|nr:uncharacterized protein LOC125215276 [Salvia hispanica]
MSAFIRKNLTFFTSNNVDLRKSPVSLPLSLHFFSTRIDPTVYDILVHKHHLPREFASQIASELGDLKHPETVDSMLQFLKSTGFSTPQLHRVIKWRPRALCWSLDRNIKPKITTLQDQGFSPPDIARIVSNRPSILGPSLKNQIIPSLSIIKELMGSSDGLVRAVRNCTRVLSANLGKTLVPNLEFLKGNGVSVDRIRVVFNGGYGYAFLRKPEVIRESFEKAKEMGLSVSSKTFIYGIVAIAGTTSSGGWEKRLQAFRDVGFTDVDVLTIFGKDPLVFLTSAEKLSKVTRVLIGTGKYDISDIVRSPGALSYSVERRYEVRVRILGVLERKNLIENWPSLQTLYSSSDAEFCERFVSPYLDHLGDVYSPKGEMKP